MQERIGPFVIRNCSTADFVLSGRLRCCGACLVSILFVLLRFTLFGLSWKNKGFTAHPPFIDPLQRKGTAYTTSLVHYHASKKTWF